MTTYNTFKKDSLILKIEIPGYCNCPFYAAVRCISTVDGSGVHTVLCEYGTKFTVSNEQLVGLDNGNRVAVENVGLVSVFKG